MGDEFDFEVFDGTQEEEGVASDGEVEDQDAGGDDESDEAAESASEDDGAAPKGDQKRIADLMSKWQRADEENKRLKAQLQANGSGQAPTAPAGTSDMAAWVEFARAQARDQIFRSDPRFDRYGFEPSQIEGTTPEQMQQSAKRLAAVLDRVETDAKNAALKKHGLNPDNKGGGVPRLPDFASMSDEDFDKVVGRAKGTL